MMQWEQLLSLRRQGDTLKRLRVEQDETRLGFEVDYDRVIFSSAFRSLQDKTQVIPLSKTSFVHTRLTHSLEVSVVGRSLGRAVGKQILEKYPHLNTVEGYRFNDFGAIVAAAALAHDIGNPPFGHSGEKAMGDYFKNGAGDRFKNQLTSTQYQDLCDFEGNANGFKILTESKYGVDGGLRLSYATLGAFMKYPKSSLPKKPTSHIADKKYGVFELDQPFFMEVVHDLGLLPRGDGRYARHPLTFLVEAADDICYTVIDFEDGINLGWIEEEMALEFMLKLVKDTIQVDKYRKLTRSSDRVAYLRSMAINTLILEAQNIFLENEVLIRKGEFTTSLLDKSSFKAQIDDIINISIKKVYQNPEVIDKEIAGYKILTGLLDVATHAYERKMKDEARHFDQLILQRIPIAIEEHNMYHNLLEICNYISRLTDGQVRELYQKVMGEIL